MQSKRILTRIVFFGLVGCNKTHVEGTGGSSSKTSSVSTSATSVATTSGGGTCDMIGKCAGDGVTPSSGCLECSIIGTASTATDAGTCKQQYLTIYGNDGMCTGGQPSVCAYQTCASQCDPSTQFTTQAQWDCLCTNDKMGSKSTCTMMQTDTNTCLGKLAADKPAVMALVTFEDCVFKTACPTSCAQQASG
jgi:hypothetical protein